MLAAQWMVLVLAKHVDPMEKWTHPHAGSSNRSCGRLPQRSEWLAANVGRVLTKRHVVFIGDSRTRYAYLNLAYHLLHGRAPPFDLSDRSSLLLEDYVRRHGTPVPLKHGDYEA